MEHLLALRPPGLGISNSVEKNMPDPSPDKKPISMSARCCMLMMRKARCDRSRPLAVVLQVEHAVRRSPVGTSSCGAQYI